MDIEKDLFKRSKVDYTKLISYGFVKDNNHYIYIKNFINDSFQARIIIDNNGKISGTIYDLTTNEEYLNIRISTSGGFVSEVREAYIDILKDIQNKCFITSSFVYEQTNRIVKYINDTYHTETEFLWPKYDNYGVFRNKHNQKWYAIIMNIDKSKITKGTGEVEIINVKANSDSIKELINKKGYYEAYHMNKLHWITIILDDTLSDEEIIKYLDESYNLIDK